MKFLFIINPNSGSRKKNKIIKSIYKYLPVGDYKIMYWKNPQQDIGNSIKNNLKDFDTVVAVGGDGTVNKVAQALINSKATMAIIPCGSGNGLARYLGIPLEIKKAIKGLYSGRIITIDTCIVNKMIFISNCGVGFDAHVGSFFAKSKKRGFWSYVRIILEKYWSYKPEEYELLINNTSIYHKALFITFANSNQFGNSAFIAPEADIQDGIINVSIVKPFPFYNLFGMAIKLFNKSIHRSGHVESFKIEEVTLIRSKPGIVQYDGEPANMGKELNIKIIPKSLSVLVP